MRFRGRSLFLVGLWKSNGVLEMGKSLRKVLGTRPADHVGRDRGAQRESTGLLGDPPLDGSLRCSVLSYPAAAATTGEARA
jgi:hypothetical protein